MSGPEYSDPLLIEASKKIQAIINELPENLRYCALYWVSLMRGAIELDVETKENREELYQNSILQYASVTGLVKAEKSAKDRIANGQIESARGLKELELLYVNWTKIEKENKDKDNNLK